MGKHVQRVKDKLKASGKDAAGDEQGLCPFTLELVKEDRSMFEVLMQDERVTNELVVNLIMALFRTGIDSVRYKQTHHFVSVDMSPEWHHTLFPFSCRISILSQLMYMYTRIVVISGKFDWRA